MRSHSTFIGAAFFLGLCAIGHAATEPTLADKVVAFCKKNKGKTVGAGESSQLVEGALKAAGAKGRGSNTPEDSIWGKQVFFLEARDSKPQATGKGEDVQPGDIVQLRNVLLEKLGRSYAYRKTFGNYAAIVSGVKDRGRTVKIYHQGHAGKKVVLELELHLNDLKKGWVRFYRPIPVEPSK